MLFREDHKTIDNKLIEYMDNSMTQFPILRTILINDTIRQEDLNVIASKGGTCKRLANIIMQNKPFLCRLLNLNQPAPTRSIPPIMSSSSSLVSDVPDANRNMTEDSSEELRRRFRQLQNPTNFPESNGSNVQNQRQMQIASTSHCRLRKRKAKSLHIQPSKVSKHCYRKTLDGFTRVPNIASMITMRPIAGPLQQLRQLHQATPQPPQSLPADPRQQSQLPIQQTKIHRGQPYTIDFVQLEDGRLYPKNNFRGPMRWEYDPKNQDTVTNMDVLEELYSVFAEYMERTDANALYPLDRLLLVNQLRRMTQTIGDRCMKHCE